jgi:hypothetical protein
MVVWCTLSGLNDQKSQTALGSGKLVWGLWIGNGTGGPKQFVSGFALKLGIQRSTFLLELDSNHILALLSVDKVGELDGITDEEDGGVVSNHIVVSFLSVELDAAISEEIEVRMMLANNLALSSPAHVRTQSREDRELGQELHALQRQSRSE